MLNDLREQLKPRSTMRVYDAVSEAGIDVSDWHNVSSNIKPAQNPRYCYRWAFEGGDRVLLCLWYRDLEFLGDGVEYRGNARNEQRINEERANDQRDPSLKKRFKKWASSSYQMDEVIKIAHRETRLVRIALVDSKNPALQDDERAAADFRLLDHEPWRLVRYEMQTGEFLLRRGLDSLQVFRKETAKNGEAEIKAEELVKALPVITAESYGVGVADQFIGSEKPGCNEATVIVWERSAKVRQIVLARSKGHCEHCGRLGFLKANGEIYVETHHVVPLSEEGADVPGNVIALCPEHHREAHFGAEREALKASFLQVLLTVVA
ncbi:HNH endonuclease [Pseudomonas sp. LB3P25]